MYKIMSSGNFVIRQLTNYIVRILSLVLQKQNHWGQIYYENDQLYKYFHLCVILVSAHRASSVASSFLTD